MRRSIARIVEGPFGLWSPTTMSDMLRSMAGMLGEWSGTPKEAPGVWGPRVDVINAEQEVIVKADLPGVKKEDLRVEVSGGLLTIAGEVKQESEVKEETHHRLERRWGQFTRVVDLPVEVKEDQISAKLQDGVLEIHAPKAEPPPPAGRTIAVE